MSGGTISIASQSIPEIHRRKTLYRKASSAHLSGMLVARSTVLGMTYPGSRGSGVYPISESANLTSLHNLRRFGQRMTPRADESPETDAALAAAYQTGDEAAAAELVRRHATQLGRYLAASGAPDADVEDLAQEAFIRAFRSLGTWRGDGTFRGWLFRIAGNLLKDQFRRRRGRIMVPIEDHDFPDSASPEGEAGANELEALLIDAIGRLPRLQREVFLMRVNQGMAYDAICAALGTSPGAARVHYHHAVKRLKELAR
ncbi:MAG: sigma-70 family RNA polymerase sigma factor [Gemmatimonadota bacterium]